MKTIKGTETALEAIRQLVDDATGYPMRGVHIGGGRHCDMPDTWDGQGPTPPGWTRTRHAIFRASATDCAYPIDDETLTLVRASADITAPQKDTVEAAAASAVDEDPTDNGRREKKESPAKPGKIKAAKLENK